MASKTPATQQKDFSFQGAAGIKLAALMPKNFPSQTPQPRLQTTLADPKNDKSNSLNVQIFFQKVEKKLVRVRILHYSVAQT
jgi:hypothetical protein